MERQSRPRPSREARIDSPMLRYNTTLREVFFAPRANAWCGVLWYKKPPDGADGGEEVSQMNEFSIKYQGRRYGFLAWNAMKESIADCGQSTYEHSRPGDGCHRSPRPGLLIDREVNQDHARFLSLQKFSFPFSTVGIAAGADLTFRRAPQLARCVGIQHRSLVAAPAHYAKAAAPNDRSGAAAYCRMHASARMGIKKPPGWAVYTMSVFLNRLLILVRH